MEENRILKNQKPMQNEPQYTPMTVHIQQKRSTKTAMLHFPLKHRSNVL